MFKARKHLNVASLGLISSAIASAFALTAPAQAAVAPPLVPPCTGCKADFSQPVTIYDASGNIVSSFGGGGGGSLSAKANASAQTSAENSTTDPLSMDLARNLRVRDDILQTAFGTTGSSAYAGTGNADLIAISKGIYARLADLVLGASDTTPSTVRFDHTTPGTTDAVVISSASPLTVGGSTVVVGGSITRPADTTAYSGNDIIGSSTSANCGSGCGVAFVAARNTTGTGYGIGGTIVGVRVSKADTVANVTIRVHFWKTSPTTTGGDNSTMNSAVNYVAALHICYVDVLLDLVGTDGTKGEAAPARNVCPFSTSSGGQLYFTLEARGAWTPTSAEVFTVAAEVYQD